VFAVAASGAMVVGLPVTAAFAADGAEAVSVASDSPGVASGNSVQVPVHVPVNVCGNTANVVALLNPALGNTCVNGGAAKGDGAGDKHGAKADGTHAGSATRADGTVEHSGSRTPGGASAHGATEGSPGLLSGNNIQIPVDLPLNVSGNSVNVVGIGNPAVGNESVNESGVLPHEPSHSVVATPRAPKPAARSWSRPAPHRVAPTLAHTGADQMAPAVGGSVALIAAGAILYRRARMGHTR
jgi:hypothetical protein